MPEKYHSGSPDHTWEDLMAAIGQDFGGPERVADEPIAKNRIGDFCEVLEFDCPLHHDEDVARTMGYRGLLAPSTSLFLMGQVRQWKPGDPTRFPTTDPDTFSRAARGYTFREPPMPGTVAYFVTGIETEYFAPMVVGDRLTARGRKLVSATLRDTSAGSGAFVTMEESFYNQSKELVAQLRTTGYHFNPWPSEGKKEASKQSSAQTEADKPYMQTTGLMELTKPDWSVQRYFEDVHEGDSIPPVPLNLTFQRLIEWAIALRMPQPPHSNPRYARHYAAPDIYANNVTVQTWWERAAREYIGLRGTIKRIGPFRIRTFAIPGDQIVTKGTVKRKWQEDGQNLVELEVMTEHVRAGIAVGPGPVVVTLPSRKK